MLESLPWYQWAALGFLAFFVVVGLWSSFRGRRDNDLKADAISDLLLSFFDRD